MRFGFLSTFLLTYSHKRKLREKMWGRHCKMSQGIWVTQSPSGVQGQSPGRGAGGNGVPQKLKHFCK